MFSNILTATQPQTCLPSRTSNRLGGVQPAGGGGADVHLPPPWWFWVRGPGGDGDPRHGRPACASGEAAEGWCEKTV